MCSVILHYGCLSGRCELKRRAIPDSGCYSYTSADYNDIIFHIFCIRTHREAASSPWASAQIRITVVTSAWRSGTKTFLKQFGVRPSYYFRDETPRSACFVVITIIYVCVPLLIFYKLEHTAVLQPCNINIDGTRSASCRTRYKLYSCRWSSSGAKCLTATEVSWLHDGFVADDDLELRTWHLPR